MSSRFGLLIECVCRNLVAWIPFFSGGLLLVF